MKVWGYVRVSTEEQAVAGNGLAAQEETIQNVCTAKGWELLGIFRDEGLSGAEVLNRPRLVEALAFVCYGPKAVSNSLRFGDSDHYANGQPIRYEAALDRAVRLRAQALGKTKLAAGSADGVLVSKMDRLGRNLADSAAVLDLCKRFSASVYMADMHLLDTGTSTGRFVATMMMALAEWELAQIKERTTAALAQVAKKGGKLGERPKISADVAGRIALLRDQNVSMAEIARTLTREGVPTAKGGTWHASTVARVLGRAA